MQMACAAIAHLGFLATLAGLAAAARSRARCRAQRWPCSCTGCRMRHVSESSQTAKGAGMEGAAAISLLTSGASRKNILLVIKSYTEHTIEIQCIRSRFPLFLTFSSTDGVRPLRPPHVLARRGHEEERMATGCARPCTWAASGVVRGWPSGHPRHFPARQAPRLVEIVPPMWRSSCRRSLQQRQSASAFPCVACKWSALCNIHEGCNKKRRVLL
jgi:hypothetical protein